MSVIAESINAALETIDKNNETNTGNTESTSAVQEHETTTENVTEESTETPVAEVSDADIEEGRNLARALKDPTLGPALIDYLATKSGYTKQQLQQATKTEEKKEELVSDLVDALPPGFEYLGEKLLPAIKNYVEKQVDERTKDIRETASAAQIRHLEGVITEAQTDFAKEFYGGKELPKVLLDEVNRLSNIYTPTQGADPKDHVLNLLHMAKGRVGNKNGNNGTPVKKQASSSVPNNLATQKTVAPPNGNGKPQKMSLKESAEAALAAMNIKE